MLNRFELEFHQKWNLIEFLTLKDSFSRDNRCFCFIGKQLWNLVKYWCIAALYEWWHMANVQSLPGSYSKITVKKNLIGLLDPWKARLTTFDGLPPFCQRFLWALYQTDESDISKGFRTCFHQVCRVKNKQLYLENGQTILFESREWCTCWTADRTKD